MTSELVEAAKAEALWALRRWQEKMTADELVITLFDGQAMKALLIGDAEPDRNVRRAGDALLGTLWQLAYAGKRTHEENWQEMDRRFPQARWLHDALKAPSPAAKAITAPTEEKAL